MASPIDGKAEAVLVLKGSNNLGAQTKSQLSEDIITGIIAAEYNDMGRTERALEGVGLEVWMEGLGPGQIRQGTYKEVKERLPKELEAFIEAVNARLASVGESPIAISKSWAANVKEPKLASFFILAALAICIDRAQKVGRSSSDALRYGIIRYHGAFTTVSTIQRKVAPTQYAEENAIPWAEVESYIRRSGSSKEQKLLKYVDTVISGGLTK